MALSDFVKDKSELDTLKSLASDQDILLAKNAFSQIINVARQHMDLTDEFIETTKVGCLQRVLKLKEF